MSKVPHRNQLQLKWRLQSPRCRGPHIFDSSYWSTRPGNWGTSRAARTSIFEIASSRGKTRKWWPETGLNRRRRPFQGRALPLSYLASVQTSVASLRLDSGRRRIRRATPRTVLCNNCDSIPTPILLSQTGAIIHVSEPLSGRHQRPSLRSCTTLESNHAPPCTDSRLFTSCRHRLLPRAQPPDVRERNAHGAGFPVLREPGTAVSARVFGAIPQGSRPARPPLRGGIRGDLYP